MVTSRERSHESRRTAPADMMEKAYDWEQRLSAQVQHVELLGEIPISPAECRELGQVLCFLVRFVGHSAGLRGLKAAFPHVLATYLVSEGIYGYQGGDYWSQVTENSGLGKNYAWQVGQAFEQILEELGLPLFYDMRAEAHRYVSLILAHGGIPNYCLPDFFDNMLQPAVTRARYDGMTPAELISEWVWHASGRYFTDKPVLRFLQYGGQVSEDFVGRCREMAQRYLEEGIMPSPEELGLPSRVVEAYGEWVVEQGADRLRREQADRWRLRKPQILVYPWGEGVILDLPPQQVPATQLFAQISWRVVAGDEAQTLPVRVRRMGFDRGTEAQTIALSQPAEAYEVSLFVDDDVMRTWRYEGVTERRPLLVFDPDSGALVQWLHSLPARRLSLLYRRDLELQVEGDGTRSAELPRMPWGWAGFRGETWDLTRAKSIQLVSAVGTVLSAPVQPDESSKRPYLVGGQPLTSEGLGVHASVYVGTPPSIRVPLSRRAGSDELSRWRLTLSSRWSAIPGLRITKTLSELRPHMICAEEHVDVPLSAAVLLGEKPIGNFIVQLRGPLGRDAEIRLRLLPHLVICGHEDPFIPEPGAGPTPATLLIETQRGQALECLGEGEPLQVKVLDQAGQFWHHEVELAPEVSEAQLTVVHPLPDGNLVRVPVPVRVRRLRWALTGEAMGTAQRVWGGKTIRCSVDELLQLRSPLLFVALPLNHDEQAHMRLRLLDGDGAELQATEVITARPGQGVWRFDLAAFLDTLRHSSSPVLRFELMGWNLPGHEEPVCLPLLSVTQTLVVQDVQLKFHRANGAVECDLRWSERIRLRNRQVRFWFLWRPWEPVIERSVPDDAAGEMRFRARGDELCSGKFRVEFLVADPWVAPAAPERPVADAPSCADVAVTSPEVHLQDLERTLQQETEQFELRLERAHVYADLGDHGRAQADWQWCFQNLDEGMPPQILALLDLLQSTGQEPSAKALRMKMFARSRLDRLLQAHSLGCLSPQHLQAYLAALPRSDLLREDACARLLSVPDETVRLHAVQQLIRRSNPLGPDTLVRWVENAEVSEADAVALLMLNGGFSADCLEQQMENATALRLLEALARELGDRTPIVYPGVWVYSDVGWGRIERIEEQSGQPVTKFFSSQSDFRLHVTLRPRGDAEPIVVDLAAGSITFTRSDKVHTCTGCEQFSASDCYLIVNRHNRGAHDGCGPGFRREKGVTRTLRTLGYSTKAPPDDGFGGWPASRGKLLDRVAAGALHWLRRRSATGVNGER